MKHLMKNLNVWQKLAVMGALSMLPFAIAAYKMTSSINTLGVEFARQELRGLDYYTPALLLMQHLQQHRALAAGWLSGVPSFKEPLASKTAEIENDMKTKVLAGGRYVSPTLAEKLALGVNKDLTRTLHETLSDREYDVMSRIASGRTVTEIAKELSLSAKTISTYRARVLEKLGVRNSAEIVQYAIRNGLVI